MITLSAGLIFNIASEMITRHNVRFIVNGNSMLPFIRSNTDSVELEYVSPQNLQKGDIVLYENNNFILHRIYKISNKKFITAGDSCAFFDAETNSELVIGRVGKIYRGTLTIDVKSKKWQAVFFLWRKTFCIRPLLIGLYFAAGKVKYSFVLFKKIFSKKKKRRTC